MTSGSGSLTVRVNLPSYQPDSELALLISGLVLAAAWFSWAVLARRDAKQAVSEAPQA